MKKLEESFVGSRSVDGFLFNRVYESENVYIYKVDVNGTIYYDVFKKKHQKENVVKIAGVEVVFEEKENYPSGEDFGNTAFVFKDYNKALVKAKRMEEIILSATKNKTKVSFVENK